MKKSMWAAGAVAILAVVPTLASAQTGAPARSEWSFTGNMSLVSDYRFRSISQTYKLPAVQGGFDLGHAAGFYAGTWASNVSGNQYPGGSGMELDLYSGYRFDLARGIALDLGLIYYAYPDAKTGAGKKFTTTEVYGGVSMGNLSAKLNYAISDNFGLNDSDGSFYLDVGYIHPLSKTTSVVLHVGHRSVSNGTRGGAPDPDYTDYKIGFTAEAAGLNWGIAYIGNNARDRAYTVRHATDGSTKVVAKDTIVLSVGKTF